MERACTRFEIRSRYRDEVHWMEKLREWNLGQTVEGGVDSTIQPVEPDQYWRENQERVLTALKLLVDASYYAWEIPGSMTESGESILIPERIAGIARSVCRDDLALIAWSNYIDHMEKRALAIAMSVPGFEQLYPYRTERELYILESLKTHPNYTLALRQFSAGIPPEHGSCAAEPMNLICASPLEAIKINIKLIYFSSENELPFLYLKIGRLYLAAEGVEDRDRKAHEYFAAAARYQSTDLEARLGLIRLHLANRDYAGAYTLAADLQNRYEDVRYDPRFRKFASSILTAIGRSRDADCFAERSELMTGVRKHCMEFKF
jgi:TPR repeat protein